MKNQEVTMTITDQEIDFYFATKSGWSFDSGNLIYLKDDVKGIQLRYAASIHKGKSNNYHLVLFSLDAGALIIKSRAGTYEEILKEYDEIIFRNLKRHLAAHKADLQTILKIYALKFAESVLVIGSSPSAENEEES